MLIALPAGSFWLNASSSFEWLLWKLRLSGVKPEKSTGFYWCPLPMLSCKCSSTFYPDARFSFTNCSIGFLNNEYWVVSSLIEITKINFTNDYCRKYHLRQGFDHCQSPRCSKGRSLSQNNSAANGYSLTKLHTFFFRLEGRLKSSSVSVYSRKSWPFSVILEPSFSFI